MSIGYSPLPVAAASINVDGSSLGQTKASFDAFLYKPLDSRSQLKLTVKLNIKMNPLTPRIVPMQLDADGNAFWTSPWTPADWQKFLRQATGQANLWNNKFWLVPPSTFTDYDETFQTFPNQVWRPNIRCSLEVDWSPSGSPHLTIDVANLNTRMIQGAGGPGTFRSHSLLYDSLDGTPWVDTYGEAQQVVHYTIAHELGHALGLHHIGTLRKTPLCQFAIAADRAGLKHPDTDGGKNGAYCYGWKQGVGVYGNIMGAGADFSVENARPWVWAMAGIRGRPWEAWRAVIADPGEGSWSKK